MPALTVLLPVHDGERFLPAAIRSTLAALPRDAQILVVDDASTDRTPAIAAAWADRDHRVRIHRRDRSTGLPDALNDGIARIDSPLIARMDADDVCLPTRFRRQVRSLRGADFVFGSSVLIDERGRVIGGSTPWPVRPAAARAHLLIGNFFSHPTMACRRDAIVALEGYRRTEVEDYELWLRAVAAGYRIRQSPVPAVAYRRHGAQVTTTWRLAVDEPVLDAAYRPLVPPALQPDVPVLRHSATTRSRSSGVERAAWLRLRALLLEESRVLTPVDRWVLRRRIRDQAPR